MEGRTALRNNFNRRNIGDSEERLDDHLYYNDLYLKYRGENSNNKTYRGKMPSPLGKIPVGSSIERTRGGVFANNVRLTKNVNKISQSRLKNRLSSKNLLPSLYKPINRTDPPNGKSESPKLNVDPWRSRIPQKQTPMGSAFDQKKYSALSEHTYGDFTPIQMRTVDPQLYSEKRKSIPTFVPDRTMDSQTVSDTYHSDQRYSKLSKALSSILPSIKDVKQKKYLKTAINNKLRAKTGRYKLPGVADFRAKKIT